MAGRGPPPPIGQMTKMLPPPPPAKSSGFTINQLPPGAGALVAAPPAPRGRAHMTGSNLVQCAGGLVGLAINIIHIIYILYIYIVKLIRYYLI